MKVPIGLIPNAVQHVDDRQERRLPVTASFWPVLVAIALAVAGCGSENAAGDETSLPATTPTSIHFPQRTSDRDDHDAELVGELVVTDGCLYVESNLPPEDHNRHLIVWPHIFELRINNDAIEVRGASGQVVARVGDLVRLGGSETRAGFRPGVVPDACHGPYWIASADITRGTEAAATQTALSASPFGIFLHRQEPEDRSGIDPAVLTGQLVVADDCLRVNADNGNSYLIVWPPDYSLDAAPMIRVLNAEEQVVARVGVGVNEVRLAGGEKETLGRNLPGRCPGPYWIVEEVAGSPGATETPAAIGCEGISCR